MKIKALVYLFIIIITTSIACKKIVPEPNVPAYIQIDSFAYGINSKVDITESNSYKIENVWVYVDNIFIGVYVLPAKIAILKTGKVKIELKPGIKQNGISATRKAYPFYKTHEESLSLEAGKTTKVNAQTSYFDFVKVAYLEAFENNTVSIKPIDTLKGINIKKVTIGTHKKEIFEGKDAGEIILSGSDTICEIASDTAFALPIAGKDVYLEINYKCTAPFTFGIIANSNYSTIKQQIFTFNPSINENGDYVWKKIYIDMTPEVSSNSNAIDYRIYFTATKKAIDSESRIWIDNIKVLH